MLSGLRTLKSWFSAKIKDSVYDGIWNRREWSANLLVETQMTQAIDAKLPYPLLGESLTLTASGSIIAENSDAGGWPGEAVDLDGFPESRARGVRNGFLRRIGLFRIFNISETTKNKIPQIELTGKEPNIYIVTQTQKGKGARRLTESNVSYISG